MEVSLPCLLIQKPDRKKAKNYIFTEYMNGKTYKVESLLRIRLRKLLNEAANLLDIPKIT